MKIETLYNLNCSLREDNLSFLYQGNFNDDITEHILDISDSTASSNANMKKINKKVSLLLAECFQNIIRHGNNDQSQSSILSNGIFITRNIGNAYYISSANLIENSEIPHLKSRLEQLNQLSTDEIKQLYLELLVNNKISDKGGAGLGLIEMSRKSGQKLEFDFESVDDRLSYFYLQIKLNSLNDTSSKESMGINIAKEFHKLMAEDNIFLVHKGDFSSHTILPILRMIENNLAFQNNAIKNRKRLIHVLVEILQNISKHGYLENNIREGIFVMGQRYDHFLIYSGNYIANEKVANFRNYLSYLNRLTKKEIMEVYKGSLNSGIVNEKGNAGLGLLNVAKDSLDKIDFSFFKEDDQKSFFGMGIVL
jgi:hypothetical protein